ncbi:MULTISPECIES: spermidine/putrescine ABC transporter substrate-binding protein [unclassified Pseudodesulfovibrio]|uniref:polyamine ABC transporter substrate-binding protein n=1 Tax=unclassified Pseudodesulfovibrio TaxID=2661612 RepID=UPI000FEB8343|nr:MULTISPECIES: spermidine/putrescine ABC transporter substrate-binding protein [unclassified Pseudodesulfovibrio]MCJ2165060.1 spermidine/putrescine ABC transporter substrate-binding protein [Pseudodesulfovibrio sp. S3-i]RWU03499.1 spermidine/putrescine ABC transporter substrate-binding protein [Pseudodesulfovibrio sp. S3]
MRKLLLAVMMVLLTIAVLAPCAFAAEEMRLLIWSEYMPEDFLSDFEKDTGIKVRVEYYESMEEMVAKLQAGGKNQYDVVVPSDYIIPAMVKLELLRELDHSKLPNLSNLQATFINPKWDNGNKYTVAYQWGTLGMMYRKDKLKDFDGSWKVIFDADKRQGAFIMVDSIREMLGVAQCAMGMDVNTTDKTELKALMDKMLEAKKSDYFAGFDVGTGGRSKVVAGTAVAAIVYNGDALRAVADNPDTCAFVNPSEGTIGWVDNMSIPIGAPHPDMAHTFINWVLKPEVGAKLSNWTQYATPNKAAFPLITPEDFKNQAIYPEEAYMSKLQFIQDLGNDNKMYDQIWTMVKTR